MLILCSKFDRLFDLSNLYLWLLLETWHYKAYSTSSPLRVEHQFGLSDIVLAWRIDFLDFGEQIFLICKWLGNRRTDFLDFERTGRTGRTGEQIFHPSKKCIDHSLFWLCTLHCSVLVQASVPLAGSRQGRQFILKQWGRRQTSTKIVRTFWSHGKPTRTKYNNT